MFVRNLLLLIVALFGYGQPAVADDYPARPIKLVVTYTTGGANDVIARIFGQKLSEQLKQAVIVENRPGGNGIPGTDYAAKSAPDGYTLLFGNTSTLVIQRSLFSKLPYDTQRDFTPVSVVAVAPTALVVHPAVAAQSVAELVALARARPGALNYASAGNGTSFHLMGELLKLTTGIQIVHVPYKGSTPAIVDLLAGRVQLMFVNFQDVLAQIKAGKIRPLASTGTARFPLLPEIPTMAEAGFKEIEAASFFAIVAPKGTPKDAIARLYAEITKAKDQTDVRQRLSELGCEPVGSSPEETDKYIRSETERWAKVVKASGASVD